MKYRPIYDELLARKAIRNRADFAARYLKLTHAYLTWCDKENGHLAPAAAMRLHVALAHHGQADLAEQVLADLKRETAATMLLEAA